MGKILTSKGTGAPDFVVLGKYPSRNVISNSAQHFTEELAKNESEQENIAGLVSHKVLIRNVAINSVQPLHFRIEFYSKDTFTDSDLDEDTFLGAVELDLTKYRRIA